MLNNRQIRLGENDYIWTGKNWYESRTFSEPPQAIVRELNAILEKELESEDKAINDVAILIQRASITRDLAQFGRAEKMIRHALQLSSGNMAALTVLCSILRARGKPQQALNETDAHKRHSSPELLTTRAAALCDLRRWEEAKKEIGRALAICESEEAFSVVHRIKRERPDLYRV